MKIAAIVLTYNESLHIERCIRSLECVATEVVVADCHSTDSTPEIACSLGAHVVQNAWVNYATQFNWALRQLDPDTDWVLRIDADEVLTPALAREIAERLPSVRPEIDGIFWSRRMKFQGRLIRHGGVSAVRVLRLFRYGRGECENRWMDEHIKVSGPTLDFAGDMVDDNLNSLTWWIDKHNKYASREAVDLLNLEFGFMPHDSVARVWGGKQAGLKRWLKERAYARLPAGSRATVYFLYRYLFCLGFLDGRMGSAFHVLQGFWYRYLVDTKIAEVKRHMREEGSEVKAAIHAALGIRV